MALVPEYDVMVVGLGEIGGYALEFLARTPGISRILAADVNEEIGRSKVYSALLGAAQQGYYPSIDFTTVDLLKVEQTAEALARYRPRVILNCASLQPYWHINDLPPDVFGRLKEAGYGPWLPMHLTLMLGLMKAVREVGLDAPVVNAAFPDAVNPVLARLNLAPAVGLGNVDNFVPGIQAIVAQRLKVSRLRVQPWLACHHFVRDAFRLFGTSKGAPYFCRIFVDGQDATEEFDLEELLRTAAQLITGMRNDAQVASSGVRNVLAILTDNGRVVHAPGPEGLVGGYPVCIDRRGAQVVVPPGTTRQALIEVNEQAQRWDGIERIETDGRVVFTEQAYAIMREVLGYDCPVLTPEESADRARELRQRYIELRKRCGVAA